jgi:23S rRNA pseudouridine1911/1915/1917 synthase
VAVQLLHVLFEDNHLFIINKMPGDLSQEDSGDDEPLQDRIKDFIKKRDAKPGNVYLGTIHRLDRPVSGALIFAKTSKAAGRLSEQIRSREIKKYYLAVTQKGQISGSHDKWIQLSDNLFRDGDITRVCEKESENTQKGSLWIRTIMSSNDFSLHLVDLITGRKHQIRAQLSSRGIPIVGDRKYGSPARFDEGAIALHSLIIRFDHPVKKEYLEIIAPLHEKYQGLIDRYFPEIRDNLIDICLSAIKENSDHQE